MDKERSFNYDSANLADQITVIGACQHLYDHCCKTASTLPEEEAVFYMTMADMVKNFRRDFSREHFPKVKDEDWCALKAMEEIRQRVYESAHIYHKDLKAINDLWSTLTEHIFGVDMSQCYACKADKDEKEAHSKPLS